MADEALRESISCLVDSEAPEYVRGRLLDRVAADQASRECWHRYHLIGEVMRGNRDVVVDQCLADRVAEQLRRQPVALRGRRVGRPQAWLGVGIAAAMVAFAVLVLVPDSNQLGHPTRQPSVVVSAVTPPVGANLADDEAARRKVASAVVPVVSVAPDRAPRARTGPVAGNPPVAARFARLTPYLVNHNGYLGPEMQGVVPYARLISYDAARR